MRQWEGFLFKNNPFGGPREPDSHPYRPLEGPQCSPLLPEVHDSAWRDFALLRKLHRPRMPLRQVAAIFSLLSEAEQIFNDDFLS